MNKFALGIDHGNSLVKTENTATPSMLERRLRKPEMTEDVLLHNDEIFTVSGERIPFMLDKTADERFFRLTQIAIARELIMSERYSYSSAYPLPLYLGVGLPPEHFNLMYESFRRYFMDRGIISFQYGGKPFNVAVDGVSVYVQGYVALATMDQNLIKERRVVIIDIGGFTTDVIVVYKGRMRQAESLEKGIITLCNRIRSELFSSYGIRYEEEDIIEALKGVSAIEHQRHCAFIREMANEYVHSIFLKARELGIDMKVVTPIFMGGGSLVLRVFVEKYARAINPILITDPNATAKAYAKLAMREMQ